MKASARRVVAISFLSIAGVSLGQGPLNPPGPPAPTMQSLDQIGAKVDQNGTRIDEAKTAIDATRARVEQIEAQPEKRIPLQPDRVAGNDDFHFVISQPGSYYLVGNLAVTKANGIQINAEDVTLDLNGFAITRASGSGGAGVQTAPTAHRATVRNGSIKGFANGALAEARSCALLDLTVSGCTEIGMRAGIGALLERCRAMDNSGFLAISAAAGSSLKHCTAINNSVTHAITVGAGATLSDCNADNNTAAFGIVAGLNASLTNCSARANTSNEGFSGGIAASSGSILTNCSATNNTSTAGSSTGFTGMGFTGLGVTMQNCAASGNRGHGIRLTGRSLVRASSSVSNGNSNGGAGIYMDGAENRIEGNNVAGNQRGIQVDSAGNFITRNTARGNTTNWVVNNAGNVILVVNAATSGAFSGNSGGTAPGSTDPNANFTY